MASTRSNRAAFGSLPTRLVVTEDGPHPPVELVTIAATPKPGHPCRPCLRAPVPSVPGGHSRTQAGRCRGALSCHAGHALHTIVVDDFDALLAQIVDRGLEPTKRETYSNGVRKAIYRDPDGHEIGSGGAPR